MLQQIELLQHWFSSSLGVSLILFLAKKRNDVFVCVSVCVFRALY